MLKTLVSHLNKEAAEPFAFGVLLFKMWRMKCLCHSCLEHQFKCRFPKSGSIFWMKSSLPVLWEALMLKKKKKKRLSINSDVDRKLETLSLVRVP